MRARRPARLPVVLTADEIASILHRMSGQSLLVVQLLYGSGLRLMEALTLRIKDVDFSRKQIHVRDPKGKRDRMTMLPRTIIEPMKVRMRCGGSFRRRTRSGGGSGFSRRRLDGVMPAVVSSIAITFMRRPCRRASMMRRTVLELQSG